MTDKVQSRFRLVLVLVLIVLLIIVGVVLWQPGGPLAGTPGSPDSPLAVSPLASPSAPSDSELPSDVWSSRGAVLLWVVLGGFLALGLAFLIIRRYRPDE